MSWTIEKSKELYSTQQWGQGFYDVDEQGEVVVNLTGQDGKVVPVSLAKIVRDQDERGRPVPLLIRFRNLLDRRVEALNKAFIQAMAENDTRESIEESTPSKSINSSK